MTIPDSPPEPRSRIARITTFTIIFTTVACAGVAAAQPSVLGEFLQGWITELKTLAQLAIVLAVILRVTAAFVNGAVASAVKMFAVGAVAIVAIEFIDTILLGSIEEYNSGTPEVNGTNASENAIQPAVDAMATIDYVYLGEATMTIATSLIG